jgi:hypothetical protein
MPDIEEKKRKKLEDWDDGRVIANMNVDGMPRSPFRRKAFDEFGFKKEKTEPVRLSREERRAIGLGIAVSYLLYGLVIFGGLALFILFCVKVWFK